MACFLCAILFVVVAAIALKIYIKLNTKWNGSYTCLVGKTAIVTGANSGIGYVTALDFAKRGARVILACRDKGRAEDATRKIIKATGNQNVIYKLVDFASLQSVRDFAADINQSEEKLHILVNNAGVGSQNYDFTSDGIQTVIQVNHIASFLLTHLLIDKLKISAPSRIVNVSSMAAKSSALTSDTLDQLNTLPEIKTFPSQMYRNSKLCNILFTTELAVRLENTGVTVNALHPGVVDTPIFRKATGYVRFIVDTLGKLYFWTPEEGAQAQIYLSVSNDVAHDNGGFYSNCKRVELYESAKDADLARKVWVKSEELANLKDQEMIRP